MHACKQVFCLIYIHVYTCYVYMHSPRKLLPEASGSSNHTTTACFKDAMKATTPILHGYSRNPARQRPLDLQLAASLRGSKKSRTPNSGFQSSYGVDYMQNPKVDLRFGSSFTSLNQGQGSTYLLLKPHAGLRKASTWSCKALRTRGPKDYTHIRILPSGSEPQ